MAPTKSSPKKATAASPRKTRQSPRTTAQTSAGVTKSPRKSPTKASPSKTTAEESPVRGRGRPKKADSPAKSPAKKAASPAKSPAKKATSPAKSPAGKAAAPAKSPARRGRPPKSATAYKDTGDDESESSLEEQPKTRRSPSKASPKRKTKATEEDVLPTTESHSPVRKTRAKSPAKSPTKVNKRSPSKSPAKTTRRSPSKSPTKTTARSPSKGPAKTIRRSSSRSPAKTTRRAPQSPEAQVFEGNPGYGDGDILMEDADEPVMAHPKRAAAAGYKTSSPGKSRQSPKSKAANWKAGSPGPKGVAKSPAKSPSKAVAKTAAKGKGKAAPKAPAPKTAERGSIESVTNPKKLSDGTENPFHKTLPAPEVWHRRMAPYFTFGETPYMEKVLSNEINRDLFKDQVSGAKLSGSKSKGKASAQGGLMTKMWSTFTGGKENGKEVRYPYAWKVPPKSTISHHDIEEAKKKYFLKGGTTRHGMSSARSPKKARQV